ncbi:hypothetical protein [Halarcobacter ebronensis]|nr:hypothetical protein [Halarcobacter ebronensis]
MFQISLVPTKVGHAYNLFIEKGCAQSNQTVVKALTEFLRFLLF